MARIRTIKPDFWTDEKLTECSLSARLFFIGLWNFSDDNGNLTRSARKLKMQILPADTIDCEELIQELINIGVLIEYSVGQEKYLHIKNFKKHQVINRKSKCSIPEPDFNDDSLNTHGATSDGKEGKGKELNTLSGKPDAEAVLQHLNEKAGKKFRPVDSNLKLILARLKEGASVEDCIAVIDRQCGKWSSDLKMSEYLRPDTLFNATKFAQYVGGIDGDNLMPWER